MKKHFLFLLAMVSLHHHLWAQIDESNAKTKLQELVVSSIKATDKKPITFSAIDRKRIEKIYYGADIPSLLQHTPSINMYSDNGTGIGYSYFRLRGMDQTRINTTVNGIPLNDPENQGVFFNNFADLASSAEQIQVQRGIGTSTNGTSAFGGSVNILTRNLTQQPEASLSMGLGSFGSSRLTAEVQTGMLNHHWMFYGRLGQVKTNGYRQNSGSTVQSYQFSLGYVNRKSILKFNFFGGNAQSKLAYSGIDKATFDSAPKTNPFVNGESDAFKQYFNQVQYSFQLASNQSMNASAYLVKSQAPQFQFLFPSSWGYGFDFFNMNSTPFYVNSNNDTIFGPGNVMSSYRLNQTYYGAFANYHGTFGRFNVDAGVHLNKFVSEHFMEAMWANYIPPTIEPANRVYFNTGYKSEQSAFAKFNYDIKSNFSVFADLQIRHSSFKYKGQDMMYRKEFGTVENMQWLFVNPRVGARFAFNSRHSVYAMLGSSMREPTRFDYLQDDFAPRDIKQNEIKPEQVTNLELGYSILTRYLTGKVNVFAMEFQNQIVGTGVINNFGYAVTGNIGKSYRRGIEFDLQGRIVKNVNWVLSSSISKNRIHKLSQTFLNTDLNDNQIIEYKNTPLALSPEQIHQIGLQGNWFKNLLFAELNGRYVSMQYLDNTATKSLSIPSFKLLDASVSLNLSRWVNNANPTISIRANNLLNQKYAPSGSITGFNSIDNSGARGQSSLYFPAAGRNYFITLSIKF
ncbi:MAG: hypothetical protein CFE21_05005 [Bacteroidetes bacterium B1(2017)]|nr:MAG: hypothetical protein CFE21_05005 [Bacteroidetes bacterium B1(2017)]